jgi:hypothetical protein
MSNLVFMVVGLVVGIGIAFLISQILTEGGYAACLVFLLVLLAVGGEFLPTLRKVPAIERTWGHSRRFDDKNS